MNLAEKLTIWAEKESSVEAVVLIGSRVRDAKDQIWRADVHSDWDFQMITSHPEVFEASAWTMNLGLNLHTYVVRRSALGGVPKVAALFAENECDFVILPAKTMRLCRIIVRLGFHHRSAFIRRKLQDLAIVIRPGWKFIKGGEKWDPFYRRIVADIKDARLDDTEVLRLADSFVCDVVWTMRKIERGEYVAAQRMLHRSLVETNIRLLHELKTRRGERSFPEGRRAELVLTETELSAVTMSVPLSSPSLRGGVEKASATCRSFVRELVGESWKWPAISSTTPFASEC